MADIEYHILGSLHGYETLRASPGLTDTDRKYLEILGFGQTDEEAYLESLKTHPAAMRRVLPSGKFALTRVLRGPLDSAGRDTLLFPTLIFQPSDWITRFRFQVFGLLTNTVLWSDTARAKEPPLSNPSQPSLHSNPAVRSTSLSILDALCGQRQQNAILTMSSDLVNDMGMMTLDSICPVELLHRYTWATRALSDSCPTLLMTLVPQLSAIGSKARQAIQIASSYRSTVAREASNHWAMGGQIPHSQTTLIEEDSSKQAWKSHSRKPSAITIILWIGALLICLGIAVTLVLLVIPSPSRTNPDDDTSPAGASTEPAPIVQADTDTKEAGESEDPITNAATDELVSFITRYEHSHTGWSISDLRSWLGAASEMLQNNTDRPDDENVRALRVHFDKVSEATRTYRDIDLLISNWSQFYNSEPVQNVLTNTGFSGADVAGSLSDYESELNTLRAKLLDSQFATLAADLTPQLEQTGIEIREVRDALELEKNSSVAEHIQSRYAEALGGIRVTSNGMCIHIQLGMPPAQSSPGGDRIEPKIADAERLLAATYLILKTVDHVLLDTMCRLQVLLQSAMTEDDVSDTIQVPELPNR